MSILDAAFASDCPILSVMGAHAGEETDAIFSRKMTDINTAGLTFWVYGSHAARPELAQRANCGYVLFIEPASKNGARPTTVADVATAFSSNPTNWRPLPSNIGPVTGRFQNSGGYALVLTELSLCTDARVDLWAYGCGEAAVKFRLGASTLLVQRRDTSADPARAKSRFRRILAVGKLDYPCAVWVG
jgi:hypothetical protein